MVGGERNYTHGRGTKVGGIFRITMGRRISDAYRRLFYATQIKSPFEFTSTWQQ